MRLPQAKKGCLSPIFRSGRGPLQHERRRFAAFRPATPAIGKLSEPQGSLRAASGEPQSAEGCAEAASGRPQSAEACAEAACRAALGQPHGSLRVPEAALRQPQLSLRAALRLPQLSLRVLEAALRQPQLSLRAASAMPRLGPEADSAEPQGCLRLPRG